MINFAVRYPIWFAIAVHVFVLLLGLVIFLIGGAIGLPGIPLRIAAVTVFTAVPLVLIRWLGWWRDAGFVTTTKNVPALAVPFIVAIFPVAWFGTGTLESTIVIILLVAAFLTAVFEEALSRGLLMRVLLPSGKWRAVLVTSVLFGVAHISQYLFLGMSLNENLFQIVNSTIVGFLYAGLRLRVNNLWPLIIMHMLQDTFYPFATLGRIDMAAIPVAFYAVTWAMMIIGGVYFTRLPAAATIDGQEIG